MADAAAPDRLISLDVFRGITIAGMVMVNNPGSWDHMYWPLDHAEWSGLTPTDWIFPFFLFIVGCAIPIALGKRIAAGITGRVYWKIFSRAAAIYLLGAAVSVIPFYQFTTSDAPQSIKMIVWLIFSAALFFLLLRMYKTAGVLLILGIGGIAVMHFAGYTIVPYNFGTFRIMGVLQRIAFCYLITSLIFLHTSWRQQLVIGIVLLLGYWLIMTIIPVPGCDVNSINDKACNLAAWLDRTVIGENHVWRQAKVYDPEGILSTIPAIVTTISGVLTGTWLLAKAKGKGLATAIKEGQGDLPAGIEASPEYVAAESRTPYETVAGMFFAGVVLFALGWIWNSFFPINKSLWTSSFVLATTGLALFTLGFCYFLIDIKGYRRWAYPFQVFGANALALFVFTGLFARMIGSLKVTDVGGKAISIQEWFYKLLTTIAEPLNASLMFSIVMILLWLLLMWLLYRKRIYLRV